MYYVYTKEIAPAITASFMVERDKRFLDNIFLSKNKKTLTDNDDMVSINEFVVPDTFFDERIDAEPVKIEKISDNVLMNIGNAYIKKFVISNGIKTLSKRAFSGRKVYVIEELILSESIKKIPSECFSYNKSIRNIVLPDKLNSIGRYAFFRTENLQSIVIPDTCRRIENSAFHSSNIKSITMGKKINNIELQAFGECLNLTSITWPENCPVIPTRAFVGCENLKEIIFNGPVSEIHNYAFYGTSIRAFDFSKNTMSPILHEEVFPEDAEVIYPYYGV